MKLKRSETVYLICYSMFIVTMFVFQELINKPRIRWVICSALGSAILLAIIFEKKTSIKNLFIRILLIFFFSFAAIKSFKAQIIVYGVLICGADMTSFKNICKTCFWTSLITIILVMVLSPLGLIPQPEHNFNRFGVDIYTFGFQYYSTVPYTFFFMMLIFFYLKQEKGKKATIFEILIIFLINFIVYSLTTLRLTYYLTYMTVFLYLIFCKFGWFDLRNSFIKLISIFLFPVSLFFSINLYKNYDYHEKAMADLNRLLSNRLSLGKIAFERYPINLFGNLIKTNNASGAEYFYIDSGYVYSLLGHGILFTFIVLLVFIFLYRYSCEVNDKVLFIWLTVVAGFNIINNIWVGVNINPLLLAYPIGLKQMKKRKTKNRSKTQIVNKQEVMV